MALLKSAAMSERHPAFRHGTGPMQGRGIELQRIARCDLHDTGAVALDRSARRKVQKLDAWVLGGEAGLRFGEQGDRVGLDKEDACMPLSALLAVRHFEGAAY